MSDDLTPRIKSLFEWRWGVYVRVGWTDCDHSNIAIRRPEVGLTVRYPVYTTPRWGFCLKVIKWGNGVELKWGGP